MSEELDILGFDPSQLSVFSTGDKSGSGNYNKNIYTAKPSESKAEDGVYYAKIRVIYSPQNIKKSVLELQSYAMQDENGYFTADSSLTIDNKDCPIFKAWKKCRFAEEGSVLWKQQAKKEDGGKQLFDKRFARYVTIQVLEDKNHPELQGSYMFWKLPKSIWEMINKKQHPSAESGNCPVPIMDFLFGYAIKLEVHPGPDDPKNPQRKTREISYHGEFSKHPVSCTNPDGSSLLSLEEEEVLQKYVDAMEKVWDQEDPEKRAALLAKVNEDPNTAELRKIYKVVLEKIKEFCPDLNAELSWKPWDEALTKRVQNWIDIILSGNDPAKTSGAPLTAATEALLDDGNRTAGASADFAGTEPEDDLPF